MTHRVDVIASEAAIGEIEVAVTAETPARYFRR